MHARRICLHLHVPPVCDCIGVWGADLSVRQSCTWTRIKIYYLNKAQNIENY